jgi:hypothetical protein
MVDKQRASRLAAKPALVVVAVAVAVAVVAVAVADMAVGTGSRAFVMFQKIVELEMERNRMLPSKLNIKTSYLVNLHSIAALIILLAVILPIRSMAQQQGQKTFSSPEEASTALVTAARSNDEETMIAILGPDGKQIVSSGDDAEDAQSRAHFVQKYKEMHRLVKEPDGTTALYVGAENWPTPIPLVNKANSWYFDTKAGKNEILYRRVGRNELSTIRVCQELVASQKEYYSANQNAYAQRIFSDQGQHNGLYWKAAEGEAQSPLGPLVASAFAKDYAKSGDAAPVPYLGYYYQILTRQGKSAKSGAKSYLVSGKMTEGFAFVAYPAEYMSSGVMTFIVNQDGVVYQKNLGAKTDVFAKAIKRFDPDFSWKKAEEPQEGTSGGRKTQ